MDSYTRVVGMGAIPVLDAQGLQQDTFKVSGRMVLPLQLEKPVAGGGPPHRFYLSLSITPGDPGELVYLHEAAPVV